MIAQAFAGMILLAGSIAPLCAYNPPASTAPSPNACRMAAQGVRAALITVATDKDQRHITRDKLAEFALVQADILAPCEARP